MRTIVENRLDGAQRLAERLNGSIWILAERTESAWSLWLQVVRRIEAKGGNFSGRFSDWHIFWGRSFGTEPEMIHSGM